MTNDPSSSIAEPALADSALGPARSKALSYVRELGVKPEHTKTVLIGASIAAGLALVVIVARARKPRRQRALDESSGVFGAIVKSALFAALQTVVKVKATQLAAKALHHDTHRTPVEEAQP